MTDSVISWTNGTSPYQFANLTSAPELPFYGFNLLTLNQTTLLTSNDFATYGLNNPINAAKLAVGVVQPSISNQMSYFRDNYDLDDSELSALYNGLRNMT